MGTDTEVVRRDADRWSLAGDRQLLAILKNMHEKVVTWASHVDTKVEEMMTGIRCAGVALENVNNRLASLSSNQFIESRVYDDDSEVTTDSNTQKEQPKSRKCDSSPSEGVLVLHRFYEELEILPDSSDTEDDEEHPSNVVLRAKDLYAERPLPAIIGSAAWRTKWHAGLLEEDSDSDSSVCKRDSNVEQYSSSDDGEELQESLPIKREHHESFTSEEIPVSDEDSTRVAGAGRDSNTGQSDDHYATKSQGTGAEKTHVAQSQSDFAAELARRLGGHVSQSECTATVATPTVDVSRGPAAKHMFSDQLYRHRVTGNLFPDEPPPLDAVSDDVMFDTQQRPVHRHHDDIFDDDDNDIFDDFADSKVAEPVRKTKVIDPPVSTIKKPVGGKSSFGSQKGAESIGAAIRKRHESSSSDDEARHPRDNTTKKTLVGDGTKVYDEKSDIFDDLFAKSERENKKLELKDDIFDDIDDIFSTEIVSKAPIKEVTITKNLFDDHDDLFADIDVNFDCKTRKPSQRNQKVVAAIAKDAPGTSTTKNASKGANSEDFKNIFGDDDDDNSDGLFSNTAKTEISKDKFKAKSLFGGSDEDLFEENKDYTNNNTNVINYVVETQENIQQEFGKQLNVKNTSENKAEETPNLFEDNKSDDLFIDHKSDRNNEFKQEVLGIDFNIKDNLEEEISPEPTSSATMSTEDHNIEKDYIDDVPISEPNNLKYQKKYAISQDEINKTSQDSTQKYLLSNKEYIDEKLDNSLHHSYLNEKQNEFSEAEKNIDELFRNSVKNENAPFSVTNDFHDIFNDHPPAVDKTHDLKKTSNINALFDDDNDDDNNTGEAIPSTANNDFHDIFHDQPPEFEKYKDIKKSKNINALFDDDSDDESLFFKKNDTLDEKPEIFVTKNDSDRIFGLFNDEPPAVMSDDDDIFSNKHVTEKKSDEETTKFATEKEQPDGPHISVPVQVEIIDHLSKENVATNTEKTMQKPVEKDVFMEADVRKSVGKIKSNININVSTLLPGASPKKINKSPESKKDDNERVDRTNETSEPDGGVFNKPLETSKIKEHPGILVKSASFDGNPESPVLCNKFSKERAKIQVRRRPSTRKARREAINKSDTDTDLVKIRDDTDAPVHSNISTLGRVYTHVQKKQNDKQLVQSDSDSEFSTTVSDTREPQCQPVNDMPQSINEDVFKTKSEAPVALPNNPDKRQLIIEDSDDEDIFKTFAHKSVPQMEQKPTQMKQKSVQMEIKKPKETSKAEQSIKIETGKVETAKPKSLFGDDSSDEELFGGSKNNKKSDSAKCSDTLLTKKPSVTKNTSLFGDDSDEDIFATHTKVEERSQPTKREEKCVVIPSTLPVTEDPLSMFDSSE